MKDLYSIIEEYLDSKTYIILPTREGISTLVFFTPYKPYKSVENTIGQIDSYYYTSNTSYFRCRELVDRLQSEGYSASMSHELIKPLAVKANLGEQLTNTLVAVENYGTKIVFQAINIAGEYTKLGDYQPKNLCKDCNKCVVACPNHALDSGFSRKDCLRNYQDLEDLGDDVARKAQKNRIIGCDTCQRVCPYNKDIEYVDMPTELKEFLRLDNLLLRSREGKRGLEYLVDHIGKNFLRVKRVRRLTVNAIQNSGDNELIKLLNEEEKNGI